jgi:hypothetical protein
MGGSTTRVTRMQTLKDLQREWDAILEAEGLGVIDKDQSITNFKYRANDILSKYEYFDLVRSHIDSHYYTHVHPRLMSRWQRRQRLTMEALCLHATGMSMRRVCSELEASGLGPCRRNTISAWIKQFVNACGIRYYSDEEMRNL